MPSSPQLQSTPIDAAGFASWHHSSMAVSDLDAAATFFEAAFGFSRVLIETGMADQIASITGAPGMRCDLVQLRHPAGGHVLELIAFDPPSAPLAGDPLPIRPGASHVAFVVRDLVEAQRAVERLGAVVLGAITSFDEGPALYCRIPGGAFLELEQAQSV